MKFLLFELYFFTVWSIIAFGAFGLDNGCIAGSTEKENRDYQFLAKSMMHLADSHNDGGGGLIYGNEIFDNDARLIPNIYIKRLSNVNVFSRGCIHRNGACDNRPNECCHSSSCRCNLWGSNCRCQRVGLFQKLG